VDNVKPAWQSKRALPRKKEFPMATTQQYRMKAAEYAARAKTVQSPSEAREVSSLERNNISLAENKEWLAGDGELSLASAHQSDQALVEEEKVLRCLGAAVIMRWNTLPRKIQRELFDYAGSIADLQETIELKEKIDYKKADGEVSVCGHKDERC
jgi:hypothetical protein